MTAGLLSSVNLVRGKTFNQMIFPRGDSDFLITLIIESRNQLKGLVLLHGLREQPRMVGRALVKATVAVGSCLFPRVWVRWHQKAGG